MAEHKYVYLCFGPSPNAYRELEYSIATLAAEIGDDGARVLIFTDTPAAFAGRRERVIDISDRLEAMMYTPQVRLHFRAKPLTLALALRMTGVACVFLDTDTFIRPGFDARVAQALREGAAMNAFVRADAYPGFGPFETDLPQIGRYRFEREASVMLNSGLIAARAEHAPLMEDAAILIDRLFAADLVLHDVEQFAVAEAFRTASVDVALIDREIEHYCQKWSKRYMRRQLRRRGQGVMQAAAIPFSKARVRLFKFGMMWRLQARIWRRGLRQGWARAFTSRSALAG